ncbi:peroxiredoxin 1 isoform X1 [Spodoptera litura]|uniref:thioredoxin-dependent peroxiredoxin n=2 Tax=Spodoptera litura TaxID=69820 RepID=A0A9J7EFB3_SPOLT|nr:peroxiredoxin 1 isoform X1 [Spodoptera litura]
MSMEHKCYCRGDDGNGIDLEKPEHLLPMMRPFSMSFNKMPLQLTKPAPQFKTTAVVNGEFKDIALSDYKGKYVVLFFYPLDLEAHITAEVKEEISKAVTVPSPSFLQMIQKAVCSCQRTPNEGPNDHDQGTRDTSHEKQNGTFVCPTEIIAFSERADDFRKIGCEVIGASTDSHFTHLAWINTPRKQGGLGPMNIPLISDKSHRIARDYGVLNEETGIPFRGLFVIDDKQNLRQITVNDLPVGRSVEETLRLVQAFQYTDKHGEVCPANWQPGSKTIKPDTKAAQEYFIDAN